MTTIAYREGILAADRKLTGGSIADCEITKISRNHMGDLCGAAGPASFISAFIGWFDGGEKYDAPMPNKDDGGEAMIVRADLTIETFETTGTSKVRAKSYSIGSGRQVAYGAMAVGASAERAVRAASEYDVYTGSEIDIVSHAE